MDVLTNAAPYLFSGFAAIMAAVLTNKRAKDAHKHTKVVDQQTLVNQTYELVLVQVRAELERKDAAHHRERQAWLKREQELKDRIQELQNQLGDLKEELSELRNKEAKVSRIQTKHLEDETRHVERRDEDRPPEGEFPT